jgi:methylamine dehydrogenase heavy chain
VRAVLLAAFLVLAAGAAAQVPEEMGTATLPERGPHWLWVDDIAFANIIDGRAYLVDADTGRMLGMLSTGSMFLNLELPRDYSRIYAAETYYSRGTRGTRTDVVTRYDPNTLEPIDEIELPPKRQAGLPMLSYSGLTDDQRFMVVYNFTPAQSVTVVDLSAGKVAAELETPGCAMVYPSGPRRFSMLCGDGRWLTVELTANGSEASRAMSEPFFDVQKDPITEKGVRAGDHWYFASFDGLVHDVDVSGAAPSFAEPWPIVSAQARAAGWRTSGAQHVAVHAATKRLYFIMRRGPEHSRKEPGEEVWVFDIAQRKRVQRLALKEPAMSIAVTPDAAPLLVTSLGLGGTIQVYDAAGKHLRKVEGLGQTPLLIQPLPPGAR